MGREGGSSFSVIRLRRRRGSAAGLLSGAYGRDIEEEDLGYEVDVYLVDWDGDDERQEETVCWVSSNSLSRLLRAASTSSMEDPSSKYSSRVTGEGETMTRPALRRDESLLEKESELVSGSEVDVH
jgi:hypothetical protein